MTPREFHDLSKGWNWRQQHQEEREAKYVTILANVSGNLKTRLRIEDVLGRNTVQQKKEISERRKVLAERRKQQDS
jgi:hypothetical protein